jgi:hypothetical protein
MLPTNSKGFARSVRAGNNAPIVPNGLILTLLPKLKTVAYVLTVWKTTVSVRIVRTTLGMLKSFPMEPMFVKVASRITTLVVIAAVELFTLTIHTKHPIVILIVMIAGRRIASVAPVVE